MTTSKLVCLLCFLLCITLHSVAQSPAIDPNWTKDTALSDEFTPTSGSHSQHGISIRKWTLQQYPTYADIGGASYLDPYFDSARTIGGNGYLMLKVDSSYVPVGSGGWYCDSSCKGSSTIHQSCAFHTGGIGSDSEFSYGYFEISAKLPGYVSVTGDTGYAAKFWPTFWMEDVSGKHYEIDMMDTNNGGTSSSNNTSI